jgi:hypothetical protein
MFLIYLFIKDQKGHRRTRSSNKIDKIDVSCNEKGFIHCKGCVTGVPDNVLKHYRDRAHNNKAGGIFNHNEKSGDDNLRFQLLLTKNIPPDGHGFMQHLNWVVSRHAPGLSVHSWVALYSAKGCQEQAPYFDYDPKKKGFPGLGVIVALENDTVLHVWPGSHNMDWVNKKPLDSPIEKKTVFLDRGDLLMFHGHLLHAGAEYVEKSNTRMHCFVSSTVGNEGNTWLLDKAPKHIRDSISLIRDRKKTNTKKKGKNQKKKN